MAKTSYEEPQAQGGQSQDEGIGHRVKGKVQRAVGAIGRAARGVMGRPEAGDDVLFQTLHADHEEVSQLFERILSSEDERVEQDWRKLSINLLAHARAEQEIVYTALQEHDETADKIPEAIQEHDDVERMLAECEAQGIGTDEFFAMCSELEQMVRHHVDEEESELLPKAYEALEDDDRDQLVEQFQELKMELMPRIEQEIAGGGRQQRRSPEQPKRQRQARSRRSTGSKSAGSRRNRRQGGDDIDEANVTELRRMAREQDIRGRSKMDRRQLVSALKRSRSRA